MTTYYVLPEATGGYEVVRRDRYNVSQAVAVCPTVWLADEVRAALQAAADAGDPLARATGRLADARRELEVVERELFDREREVEDAEDRLAGLGAAAAMFAVPTPKGGDARP